MASEDAVKAVIDELSKMLSVESVIGEPIEMEDKIILPVMKIGIGFGTRISHGRGAEEKGTGGITGGAGGGGGIFPAAIVVIFKGIEGPEGIRVMPLATQSVYTELAESATKIASTAISRLTPNKEAQENRRGVPHVPPHATRVEIK